MAAIYYAHCVLLLWTAASVIRQAYGVFEVCETEIFQAKCERGKVIVIRSAVYGRMKFGRCVGSDFGFVGCNASVLQIADRWCSGRPQCQIPIPNSAFKSTRPCPRDLTPYFEAHYDCVDVELAREQSCQSSSFILPSATAGYISNYVTIDTHKGSVECPWMIQARHGQQVNVTLYDFAYTSAIDTNSVLPDNVDICHVYATLRERSKSRVETVCSGTKRIRRVYTSVGHALEIRVQGTKDNKNPEYFLLKYESCADPVAPDHARVEREGDVAVIRCPSSGKEWQLMCLANKWQGDYGNCTQEVSLIIVIAIAMGIGIIVLAFGLICIKGRRKPPKRRKTAPKRRPVNTVPPTHHRTPPKQPEVKPIKPTRPAVPTSASQGLLPPPPPFLMDSDVTENEYAYISEMPPPPPTPSPPPPSEPTPNFPDPPPPVVFANAAHEEDKAGRKWQKKKDRVKEPKKIVHLIDAMDLPPPVNDDHVIKNHAITTPRREFRRARGTSDGDDRYSPDSQNDFQFSMKIYEGATLLSETPTYFELEPDLVPYGSHHYSRGQYPYNSKSLQGKPIQKNPQRDRRSPDRNKQYSGTV